MMDDSNVILIKKFITVLKKKEKKRNKQLPTCMYHMS